MSSGGAEKASSLTRATPCSVKPLVPAAHGHWNGYVRQHPEATFFHLIEWESVLVEAFRHRSRYLYAESNGRIVGVLPLVEVRSRLFGHALISTPFCVYGGILADTEDGLRALGRAARELGQQLGVDYIEMRNRRRQHPDWLTKDLYVTFRGRIDSDPERNMLAIPRKQRAMVRKGMQRHLEAQVDPGIDRAYDIYSESLRNLGTPVFSRRYMALLKQTFGEQCEALTITHEGTAVASVLSFYFRDEVLPYYGGGTAAARSVAANDFMYWQVMERARERGTVIFDFGRSKRGTGSFDFKAHWGFEAEPLQYEYFLVKAKQIPDLSPKNPRYAHLIRAWRRLPVWLTRLIGPPIARYLG